MNSSYYIILIFLFVMIGILLRRNRLAVIEKALKKRRSEDRNNMIELAKRFIGKDCLIYAFDGSHQYSGILKEVSDGAILIEKDGKTEAINLDFVIRIREYPTNKKGQRKSVILD